MEWCRSRRLLRQAQSTPRGTSASFVAFPSSSVVVYKGRSSFKPKSPSQAYHRIYGVHLVQTTPDDLEFPRSSQGDITRDLAFAPNDRIHEAVR